MLDLSPASWILLWTGSLLVALLYSSVGHGGATGYLTLLALCGVMPDHARTCALITNCLVASLAWYRFRQAGHFDGQLLLPLAVASIPAAWFGSRLVVSLEVYRVLLGIALIASAVALTWQPPVAKPAPLRILGWPTTLVLGAALGLLAGLTGIGGGVFLSPLLLLLRAAHTRAVAGVSAGFIVLNSIAGLLGLGERALATPPALGGVTLAAVLGALLGVRLGAVYWSDKAFRRALACVLLLAGIKLGMAGGSELGRESRQGKRSLAQHRAVPLTTETDTHTR